MGDHSEEVVPIVERDVRPAPLHEEVLVGELALRREERGQGERPLAALFRERRVRRRPLLLDGRVCPMTGCRAGAGLIGLARSAEQLVRIAPRLLDHRVGRVRRASHAAVHLAVALLALSPQALVRLVALRAAARP